MQKLSAIIPLVLLVIATALITHQYDLGQKAPIDQKLRYFRDDVTVSGEDREGNHFLLRLGLNRKEIEQDKFVHYYSSQMFYLDKTQVVYSSNFLNSSPTPQVNQFLHKFENEIAEDLSTKESYQFEVSIDDNEISASLNDLVGDFITKNRPEYTRYLSAGSAEVIINGEKLEANALLEKSYSSDQSKYLFFDGYDDLSTRTYKFALWDNEGNFYLIDDSTASSKHPSYKDHTWILYKNKQTGGGQKAFSGNIDFQENGREKNWQIKVPDLGFDFDLSTNYSRDASWYSGPISGTVNNAPLKGFFTYKKE